jgi:hypothetical protein
MNIFLEMKRSILIVTLAGITKSISEHLGEFVLHIKDDYDYRMRSE